MNDYKQIEEKVKDIYLLINQGEIIGSVACYGNEIDDLIVNKKFQHKGFGKQLLLWAMQHIRDKSDEPITLHVAKWNKRRSFTDSPFLIYTIIILFSRI